MKDTNEIEKQLKLKADAYIEQKAQEMFAIHEEIANYVGTSTNYIDYITHFNSYDSAGLENKSNHTAYASHHQTKKKYKLELEMNYKSKLVAKYTKELIMKLDIFE
ncbi:hypothetical protein N9Y89_00935 [bacterium]|nr:hypothetical protein [bacterium]